MANSYRYAASQKCDRGHSSRMDDVFARKSARRHPRHAGRLRAFHATKAGLKIINTFIEKGARRSLHSGGGRGFCLAYHLTIVKCP